MKNKIIIIGFGSSGKWAYNLAIKQGYMPIIYDDEFMFCEDIEDNLIKKLSFAVVSPAVQIEHKLLCRLRSFGVPIISEIEFAYYFKSKNSKIIGVTGTNGKTTTVRLINSILNKNSLVAGNIGIPYSKVVSGCDKDIVLELSSFQLQNIVAFTPDVAVFTNFAPDHLDYHKNFKEYKSAKLNLIKNTTSDGKIIYNYDCVELRKEIEQVSHQNIYYVSTQRRGGSGIFIEDVKVKISDKEKDIEMFDICEIGTRPIHEIQNILTSTLVAYFFNIERQTILAGIKNFKPSPYRQQELNNEFGIKIINDSKSTNLASTIVALQSFQGSKVLIVGGMPKNEDYSQLFLEDFEMTNVIAYGEARGEFFKYAKKYNFKNFIIAETLSEAFDIAMKKINTGEILLFSPACSSFDQFSSYLERGQCFDKLVEHYES